MKTYYLHFRAFAACFTLLLLVNCTSNSHVDNPGSEENKVVPGEQIVKAFDARYSNATHVSWSTEEGYFVADFLLNSQTANAWFSKQGEWLLEKTTTLYDHIEPVVSEAFDRTTYAKWKIKEVYVLDRKSLTPIYGLSVTSGSTTSNLYFTLYGDFIKVLDDVHNHTDMPIVVPSALLSVIHSIFGSPEIVDVSIIDVINSEVSAGLIDDMLFKTAIFSRNYTWIVNFWDVTAQTMPDVVWAGFNTSIYSKLRLLRMRAMETSTSLSYLFYLDNNGKSMVAEFNEKGQLLTIISRNHPMAKYLLMR
jgi:hypothetical protein